MKKWWIGVDVSKLFLDACALSEGERPRQARFGNDAQGIARLLGWAASLGEVSALGMESTGGYELDLALSACQAGLPAGVENPRRVRDLAKALGFLNKTDRADARAIAEYLKRVGPSPWRLADPLVRELCQLGRHRAYLLERKGRAANRLEHRSHLPDLVVGQLQEELEGLERDLGRLEERRRELALSDPSLKRDLQALKGVPGVGEATAMLVLSEMGDVERYGSAQSYAAAAGLNPCRRESGKWKGKSALSKAGNAFVRSGLFMSACVGARCHPALKALRGRLLASGKAKKQALAACMRKLLMICYGVLKAVRAGKEPYYGLPPEQKTLTT